MMQRSNVLPLAAVIAACGGSLTSTPDAGDAGIDAAIDATSTPDASAEATVVDSGLDVADAKVLDAPYVDLDAATSPWAVNFGPGQIWAVAVDSNLDVLAGGGLAGQTFFLDELDKDGNELWKKTAYQGVASSVAFDPSGNVLVSGGTSGTLDVGGGSIGPGSFIIKFDSNGKFQWQYGPFANTNFAKVRTRSNGHVLAVGSFTGTENFGGGSVNAGSYRAVILLELDANKAYVDSKVWKGGDYDAFALAVDPYDSVFIAGRFAGSIDFGGGSMAGPSIGSSAYNGYVAVLDSKNTYLHQMETKTSDNNAYINDLASDWMGNVLVSANAGGSGIDLGGGSLACGAIIGKLDGALNHDWSKCFDKSTSYGVAPDPTAGATIAGRYVSGASFGKFSLPNYDGFFATQFDATGKLLASFGSGSGSGLYEFALGVAYLTWPDVVVGGFCFGPITLPSGTLTCGSNDAFVARLQP